MSAPTDPQRDYVNALQKKLRLPDAILDAHCRRRFQRAFAELDRIQVSALIEELAGWKTMPSELRKAMGQQSLFEVTA